LGGDCINPSVPAIFTAKQIDCIISKVHHAFFGSFKYFHAVGTGKFHGKRPPSAQTNQSMGGSLYGSKGCARMMNLILFLELSLLI
jgi:hypothetical protein